MWACDKAANRGISRRPQSSSCAVQRSRGAHRQQHGYASRSLGTFKFCVKKLPFFARPPYGKIVWMNRQASIRHGFWWLDVSSNGLQQRLGLFGGAISKISAVRDTSKGAGCRSQWVNLIRSFLICSAVVVFPVLSLLNASK